MSKETAITIENEKVVVASVEAACVAAFYATEETERATASKPFLHLLASLIRLNGLGQCNTKEEVKELLGEALLWLLFLHFLYAQEGDRGVPCKWFKSHEWSSRGPDRDFGEWTDIMGGVRDKSARLAGVFARCGDTTVPTKNPVISATMMPLVGSLTHDRQLPGLDVRSLCDMYKLSPRECFEAAILRRKDILNAIHKKYCGKNNQKPL